MRLRHRHFNPAAVGAHAVYDSRFLGLTDNSAVASWTDRSANARHAAQSVAIKKPTFKTGIRAGQPIVRFNGSNGLQSSAFQASNSMVVVSVFIGLFNGFIYERGTNYDTNGGAYLYTSKDASISACSTSPNVSAKNAATNWGLGSWMIVSHFNYGTHASLGLRVNGVLPTISTFSTNNKDVSQSENLSHSLGSRNNGASVGLTGDIGFLAFLPTINASLNKRIEHSAALAFKIPCS